MSHENFLRAYAPERIGRPWGYRSDDYATGYHRGGDYRKLSADESHSVETEVVAISDGVVDYVGRPNDQLGPTIRIRRDQGGYEFHGHSIAGMGVGTRTTAGTVLGRNAHLDERPGNVSGMHDHIVFSDYADGAWNTDRPTLDPQPIIDTRMKEIDMPLNAETDYAAFSYMLQRALKWDVRRDGLGADAKLGPSVFDMLGAADDSADIRGIAIKLTDADRAAIVKAVTDAVTNTAGGASRDEIAALLNEALAKLTLKAS